MISANVRNRAWFGTALTMLAVGAFGEEALVRLNLTDGGMRTERIALEVVSPTQLRFTYPKERIADDVASIDVVPDFMTAQKGDEGYWIDARGAYGRFDRDAGADDPGWTSIGGDSDRQRHGRSVEEGDK